MGNTRIMLRTTAGNFFYPADYMVATVWDDKLGYEFAYEVKTGAKILVRKSANEELTLDGHIIPTLWAQSSDYRSDRAFVFSGDGLDIPKKTKLSEFLKRNAAKRGMTNEEAVNHYFSTVSEYGYKRSAIGSWMKGEVMFPIKNPNAILDLAQKLDDVPMAEWARSLIEIEPSKNPVKKLRVLHSGIRSLFAKPKGRGEILSGGGGRQAYQQVISLSSYIETLKGTYGQNLFDEFVMPANLLEIREIDYENRGIGHTQAEDTGMERGLVGFMNRNTEKKSQVLSRYKGPNRGEDMESALSKTEKLVLEDAFPYMKELTDNFAEDMKLKPRIYSQDTETYVEVMQNISHYLFHPVFNGSYNTIGKYLDEHAEFNKNFLKDRDFRDLVRKVSKSDAETIGKKGRNLPYFKFWIEGVEKCYGPIEKLHLTYGDWLVLSLPAFADQGRDLDYILEKVHPRELDDIIKDRWHNQSKQGKNILSFLERPEVKQIINSYHEIVNKSRLPPSLRLIQIYLPVLDSIESRREFFVEKKSSRSPGSLYWLYQIFGIKEKIENLKNSYGISSFYLLNDRLNQKVYDSLGFRSKK